MKKKLFAFSLVGAAIIGTCTFFGVSSRVDNLYFANAANCAHTNVVHHDKVEPNELFAGVAEYWCCCECHTSFKDSKLTEAFENTSGSPTSPSDGRYLAPVGGDFTSNIMLDGAVSAEAAPTGYNFTKVFEMSGKQGQFIFGNETSLDISGYKRVSFAVKGGVWFIIRGSWDTSYGPNSWKVFTLVQTGVKVWSIYSADAGGAFSLKYENISGATIKEVMGFGGESSTYYVTNLRVMSKDITRQDVVASSSVLLYEETTEISPFEQFTTVTKGTKTYTNDGNSGQEFLSDMSMDGLDSVSFAVKCEGASFAQYPAWDPAFKQGTWYLVTITRDGANFDTTVAKQDGTTLFTYEDKATFRKALVFCCLGHTDELTWYSTEVRGAINKVTPSTVKIDEYAYCGNGFTMQASTMNAPAGFAQVGYWRDDAQGSLHGKFFSGTVLTNYSTVTFAVRSTGWVLFNGWDELADNALWSIFTLTNNGDNTWNLVITNLAGATIHSVNGLSDVKEGSDAYTSHALNALLYGNPSTGYTPFKNKAPFCVWATELRGTLA